MSKEAVEISMDEKSVGQDALNNHTNDLSKEYSTLAGRNEYLNGVHCEETHKEEEVPHAENLSLDDDTEEKNNGSQKLTGSAASKPANGGIARSNRTVPQPFALATEKRASGNRAFIAEAAGKGDTPHLVDNQQLSNSLRKMQINSVASSRKPLQPDNTMHPDDEDSCSLASSAPSARNLKVRTTVATAPTFRSSERAEKRKEYYSKLEEKHQALEAEKMQSETRTKEEQEAALKQLRKSLNFKATPMPSFYHEGPPPKVELKKVPPTRAKSPKLGRRKSLSDANIEERNNQNGVSGRMQRHSLGNCKETRGKPQGNTKITNAMKGRGGSKFVKERESPKAMVTKAAGETTLDVAGEM